MEKEYSVPGGDNSTVAKSEITVTTRDQKDTVACTSGGEICSLSQESVCHSQVSGTNICTWGALKHGAGDQVVTEFSSETADNACPVPVLEQPGVTHEQVEILKKPDDQLSEQRDKETSSLTMSTEGEESSADTAVCLSYKDQSEDLPNLDTPEDCSHSPLVPSTEASVAYVDDQTTNREQLKERPDWEQTNTDSRGTEYTSTTSADLGAGTGEVRNFSSIRSVHDDGCVEGTDNLINKLDFDVQPSIIEESPTPEAHPSFSNDEVSDKLILPSEIMDAYKEELSVASWDEAKEFADKDDEDKELEDKVGGTKEHEEEEDMEVGSIDDTKIEEDQTSEQSSSGTSRKRHGSGSSATCALPGHVLEYHGSSFPAANLFEYQWPPESGAEWYMLQEQISEFLTIKSFKRKYPELQRRSVDMKEKQFLAERGVVSETQCDLGLTALKSEEVLDLMTRDYPAKYQEYAAVLHEKERQTISEKHKQYEVPKLEKSKLADYMKKAVKSAAEFNIQFQRERREDRRAYFDLQTMAIHYPKGKYKIAPAESTRMGPYPVTLMPGQYQDYHKTYTSNELKYFPVSTALYGPPKKFKEILAKPSTGDTSDDTAGESEEDHDGSDSGSDDGDSSESESTSTAPAPQPAAPFEDSRPATPNGATKNDKQKSAAIPEPEPPQEPVSAQEEPKKDKREEKEQERKCRICSSREDKVKNEDLVQCSECKGSGHPTCLELTTEMIPVIKTYPWQCMECKTCVECMDPYDEDKMMFCDKCDRGYHTFCVGVKSIPTGRWECPSCRVDQPSRAKKSRRQTNRQNGVPSPKPAIQT